MYYVDLAEQLNLMISICFTFYIFVSGISWHKKMTFHKLIYATFFTPFFIYLFSFFILIREHAQPLAILSNIYWVMVVMLVLLIKRNKDLHGLMYIVLLAFPPVISIMTVNYNLYNSFFVLILSVLLTAISAATMLFCLLYSKKEYTTLFLTLTLIIGGTTLILLMPLNNIIGLIHAALKLIGYCIYVWHYHTQTFRPVTHKINEAEEQLSEMQKTITRAVKKEVTQMKYSFEKSQKKLVEISKMDAMTNAYNKTAIIDHIDRAAASNSDTPFSLLMFDIDNFKAVNDSYGHIVGDKCIKKLSLIARSSLRDGDVLGRYGGDEFVIFIPEANLFRARDIAERFRMKVEETESPNFTVSIGVATFPEDGRTSKELIDTADKGLYKSKEKGKNMVSHVELF